MLLSTVFLGLCPLAFSLDPSLNIDQYAHTSWGTREGFNVGHINAIAQTPDGYLWLGTEFGLYRFDGVRAVQWSPSSDQRSQNTYIRSLLAARNGSLWIGTYSGLASWKDGKLTQYPELSGQEVGALVEDREGTIWAGTGYQTVLGKLCAIRANSVECFGGGRFGNAVYSVYEDPGGTLWVGAVNGLWRWKPGPPKFFSMPDRILSLSEAENGALLVLMRGGIKQLFADSVQAYPLPRSGLLELVFRDRDGSLWIGMQYGLLHIHQGKMDAFMKSDGLSGDVISAIFEDREGSVWVATENGLDRFRELAVVPLSPSQGFFEINHSASLVAARDGSIWISNSDLLSRWSGGEVTMYTGGHKGPSRGPEESASGAPVQEIADPALAGEIMGSLFEDHRGRIWASTIPKAVYFENNRFVPLNSTAPCKFIHSFAEDNAGDVWISAHELLCHLRGKHVIELIPWTKLGANDFAETLVGDPVRGGLWLGFFKGGVRYFKDGQIRRSYTDLDGLGDGRVNSLRLDRQGVAWVATIGGLSRIQDGHVITLGRKNGLPCDSLDWSIEDDAGSLWLNMACGLVRIAREELDSWVANSSVKVQSTVFDSSDGVKSHAFYISTTPHVAKSSDGKIWFTNRDGVSIVDPGHLPTNKLTPPLYVEQITADGKIYQPANTIGLPPVVRNLAIDYTALSFVAPEKIRFRVKLEGQDKDWKELVNVRHVEYTNLGPKHYRFLVKACNNSGVWNEEGAALDFVIPPAWYQTYWFLAACVAAFLALLWAIYQYRLHQLDRQFNVRLEERVGERTRIARDLHDTLLQSFHGILLFLQSGINLLDEHPAEAKKTLKTAAKQAERAIIEGREAVQGLRASTVERNDLAAAIKTLGGELAAADSSSQRPEFGVQVEGIPRNLNPILRDEVFQIAGEAMRNAFRHADAKQIEVEIRYDERQLRVRVRDDGKGIDPKLLSDHGREGHYGLRGMRERAKLVGGKLTVWSELDSGTEMELSIPASRAYTAPDGQRSWLAERFAKLSGKDTELKS